MRARLWLPLALVACEDPADSGNGAIEITGYLDAARVSWTRLGDEVEAAGRDGAATPGAAVALESPTELVEGTVSEVGAFSLWIPAAEGERLVLSVDDDEVVHDVPAHGDFPATSGLTAYADLHEPGVAVVEVTFAPPREDGHVWVTNPAVDGAVVVLDVFDGGLVHGGHLAGHEGDTLRLHWVPLDGVESLAIEVVVHPPAR